MEAEGNETKIPIDTKQEEVDDDPLVLSSQALEALKEFLNEQNQNPLVEDQQGSSEEVTLVTEDWRLSQFWYDQETAETVAKEIQHLCLSTSSSVACIACPTLYAYLKKIDPSISIRLLEYDQRFEQYGTDFTFYDYNQPENLPLEMKHGYRVVVADPPYLSKECLEKVAQTMEFLMQTGDSYLLLLTGGVQRERAAELLSLYPCGFRPQHSSKLGNEFLLFTNYNPGERLGGWERDKYVFFLTCRDAALLWQGGCVEVELSQVDKESCYVKLLVSFHILILECAKCGEPFSLFCSVPAIDMDMLMLDICQIW